MTFDEAFDRLIGHEGGYVNHKLDPGGETKWGISKRAYPDVNIASLTREQAKAIYRRDYWERAKADQYDGAIAFQLFDAAVNHGIGQAVKFLQRAVGVKDDGIVGPVTLRAVQDTPVADVLMRFNAERLDFYTGLSTWGSFGKGWARRVAGNLRYASEDA